MRPLKSRNVQQPCEYPIKKKKLCNSKKKKKYGWGRGSIGNIDKVNYLIPISCGTLFYFSSFNHKRGRDGLFLYLQAVTGFCSSRWLKKKNPIS